ncbi:hypothetical protein SAMN02799630_00147 [Paenibacillus sp. UNCCL117]|nr:hypothetical protein SAMN04488602_102385 [Paenibacillus sp. cl123]SFW11531.1 hypothetical protein SAMN02799630_00147 [Paenibacillus sp. UNCCL117]
MPRLLFFRIGKPFSGHSHVFSFNDPAGMCPECGSLITGLHMSDISRLMDIMNRLVDGGNTVVVIERNLDMIKSADWIIDVGPEGGHRGGQIVFEGTPVQLAGAKHLITGTYLRKAEATQESFS